VTSDFALTPRRVADSATEMAELVLPHQANVHGSVLGGTVMHWIDLAAAVVANRHCRRPVVTAAIDEMSFQAPILVGQLALLRAHITLVDRSSMEIRVDVDSEDLLTGERRHTSTAYVTFVAIDPVTRRPVPVPPLELATDEELAEHARAKERRRIRLEHRDHLRATRSIR
jgi:acyl-CoA hydrolase